MSYWGDLAASCGATWPPVNGLLFYLLHVWRSVLANSGAGDVNAVQSTFKGRSMPVTLVADWLPAPGHATCAGAREAIAELSRMSRVEMQLSLKSHNWHHTDTTEGVIHTYQRIVRVP